MTPTEQLLQRVSLIVLGQPLDSAAQTHLAQRFDTEGAGWLIDLVNDYLSGLAKVDPQGTSHVIAALANNGWGIGLTAEQAQGLAEQVTNGSATYASLISVALTSLTGAPATTLEQRLSLATNYVTAISQPGKEGLGDGAIAKAFIQSILLGVSASSRSLESANQALEQLMNSLSTAGVSMQIIDGYIAGADVLIDANGNGSKDAGEFTGKTDASGKVMLPPNVSAGKVVASGGTDLLTGKAFNGVLTAPAGTTMVTPVTTLVDSLMSQGLATDVISATASVQRALGIPEWVNALTFDPLASLSSSTSSTQDKQAALSLLSVQQQIATVFAQAATVITGAAPGGADQLGANAAGLSVVKALSQALASTPASQTLDLKSESTIVAAIEKAAASTGTSISAKAITAVSQVVAQSNTLINEASKNTNVANALTEMSKTAGVAQSDLVEQLKNAVSSGSTTNIESSLGNVSGAFASGDIGKLISASAAGSVTPGVATDKVTKGGSTTTTGGTTTGGGGGGGGGGDGGETSAPAPTSTAVALVSTAEKNDTYHTGETIKIAVTFDMPVVATGLPTIGLTVGSVTKTATYASTSQDRKTIEFDYTIESQDNDIDGVQVNANSLQGTLKNSAGTRFASATLAETTFANASIDGVPPLLLGASFNGSKLSLSYDSQLDGSSLPPTSAFAVTVEGVAAILGNATLDSSKRGLNFAVSGGDFTGKNAIVSYTPPSGTNATPIQDALGNDAVAFANRTTTNGSPPSGALAIIGVAKQNEVVSVGNTLSDADGLASTISFQWKVNGTAVAGATDTNFTLTQDHVGKTITLTASYTDGLGNKETVTTNPFGPVEDFNDAATGSVTVTNTTSTGATPRQGDTLMVTNNLSDLDCTGGSVGTVTYQWLADNVAIQGGTGTTLTLSQSEVGKVITARATYTDAFGVQNVTSDFVSRDTVANLEEHYTGNVSISGASSTPTYGDNLTVGSTIADPDGIPTSGNGALSYQWRADGTNINGATGSIYKILRADVGKKISVLVSFTDNYGTSYTVPAELSGIVQNHNNAGTGAATISAPSVAEGQVATANTDTMADVDGIGNIALQWYANAVAIQGATTNQLTFKQAQVGKKITVVATYTDNQGFTESKTSAEFGPVTNVNQSPQGGITFKDIDGNPINAAAQGQTLVATQSITDEDGIPTSGPYAISYQWKVSGVDTSGDTGNPDRLTLTQTHVGKVISVSATYTDLQGTKETVQGAKNLTVLNVNDAPQGGVTFTPASPKVGETLTADITAISDADGLPAASAFSYQWQGDGVSISGATAKAFRLTPSEAGKQMSVVVSYTDNQNTKESVTSSASPPAGMDVVSNGTNAEIRGNKGEDTLTGSATPDLFVITKNATGVNPDHILSFASGSDVILIDLASFGINFNLSLVSGQHIPSLGSAGTSEGFVYSSSGMLSYNIGSTAIDLVSITGTPVASDIWI